MCVHLRNGGWLYQNIANPDNELEFSIRNEAEQDYNTFF